MATRTTLNVSLTPALGQLVDDLVKEGQYQSSSEVVREGLRLLSERNEARKAAIAKLNADVAIGMDQLRRGQTVDGETFMREMREKLQRRAAQQ
jgi:antitoxin ParD1/3/4